MNNSKPSKSIAAVLLTALVLISILVGCGGAEPTPQVRVITPTGQSSQEVVPTEPPTVPPPTDTPTSEPPTAPPPSETPTSEPPTASPAADTPVPEAPTATPSPTETAVPDTPTPVPTKRPTNTPEISYPAPTLLAPQEKDAESLRGQVTFVWSYPRPLEADEAFQVLIWREGEPHWGAAELWTGTEQLIDLDTVLPQRGGPGEYVWTVVVREKGTEQLLSPEAAPWRLTYLGPWDPCASCDCQNKCRQGACDSCCDRCCNGCK
jgi:hypothetical protein